MNRITLSLVVCLLEVCLHPLYAQEAKRVQFMETLRGEPYGDMIACKNKANQNINKSVLRRGFFITDSTGAITFRNYKSIQTIQFLGYGDIQPHIIDVSKGLPDTIRITPNGATDIFRGLYAPKGSTHFENGFFISPEGDEASVIIIHQQKLEKTQAARIKGKDKLVWKTTDGRKIRFIYQTPFSFILQGDMGNNTLPEGLYTRVSSKMFFLKTKK